MVVDKQLSMCYYNNMNDGKKLYNKNLAALTALYVRMIAAYNSRRKRCELILIDKFCGMPATSFIRMNVKGIKTSPEYIPELYIPLCAECAEAVKKYPSILEKYLKTKYRGGAAVLTDNIYAIDIMKSKADVIYAIENGVKESKCFVEFPDV